MACGMYYAATLLLNLLHTYHVILSLKFDCGDDEGVGVARKIISPKNQPQFPTQ